MARWVSLAEDVSRRDRRHAVRLAFAYAGMCRASRHELEMALQWQGVSCPRAWRVARWVFARYGGGS